MLLFLSSLSLLIGQVISGQDEPQDIVTKLVNLGHYNNILYFLKKADMADQLLNAPSVTLFLPTDEALANQPAGFVSDLIQDIPRLRKVLEYHCVVGEVATVNYSQNNRLLTSLTNQTIRINYYRFNLNTGSWKQSAQGVLIQEGNLRVANGIIHGIGGFMVPAMGDVLDIVSRRSDMKTISSLITLAGISDTFKAQNLTLFAPTDSAFAKVNIGIMTYLRNHTKALKDVLLYHLLDKKTRYSLGMIHVLPFGTAMRSHDKVIVLRDFHSGDVFINNALMTERDISATNGVMHVIDDILIPTRTILEIEKSGISLV